MKVISSDPRMAVDRMPDGGYSVRMILDDFIIGKITGRFTIGYSTFYQWAEVRALRNGSGYELLPGGRYGDTISDYAAELNSASDVPIGTIVYLRPRIIADTSLLSGSGGIVSLLEFQHFAVQIQSGSIESGSGSFESGSVSGSIESGSESGSVSGSVESGSIISGSVSGSIESGSAISGSIESGSVVSGSVESGSVVSGSIESGSISGSVESGSVVSGSVESGSVESGSVSGSIESGSIESGSVSGSIESGSVSGSVESGSISGSVESGSISGAISGSEYGPISGESGSTPCNTSGVLTIEVVTDVQCVNGSIVVTKQTIAIPGGVIC